MKSIGRQSAILIFKIKQGFDERTHAKLYINGLELKSLGSFLTFELIMLTLPGEKVKTIRKNNISILTF